VLGIVSALDLSQDLLGDLTTSDVPKSGQCLQLSASKLKELKNIDLQRVNLLKDSLRLTGKMQLTKLVESSNRD
jgi:hypothetical protein